MKTILITGASGFIGRQLAKSLSGQYEVICLGRTDPELNLPWIPGEFYNDQVLTKLGKFKIDGLVHLAAVTGNCSERDGIMVNVEGTRVLMRYLIDRGCKKFVMASSTAVIGFQDITFRPLQLPIPDEHPCLDIHGYGLSKYLMEKITAYHSRQNPEIDVINLRLAAICPDDDLAPLIKIAPLAEWAVGSITMLPRSEAVRVLSLALNAPLKPGMKIMNACSPYAWTAQPVTEVLYNWWKDDIDLSYFEKPGNEYSSLFDTSRISQELGFTSGFPHRS